MNTNWQYLDLSFEDNYVIVKLNRGRSNPLNLDMIREITNCFEEIDRDPEVGGVILTGQDGFFSVGLDVLALSEFDKKQIAHFWPTFLKMAHQMNAFSKPFVAAITGHSPAGGCVMAITADYRVMAEGKFKIGLNEVQVGIIASKPIFKLYSFWIGERLAGQYLLEAKMLNAAEAHQVGLVDTVVPMEKVLDQARAKMKNYLSYEQGAWKSTKKGIREELIQYTDLDPVADFEEANAQWWSPGAQKVMGALVANLRKPK